MRRRIAIAISSLVAAAVLAVGLAATGFGPEPRSTPAGAAGTDVVQNVGAETVVQGVSFSQSSLVISFHNPSPRSQCDLGCSIVAIIGNYKQTVAYGKLFSYGL